MPQAAYCLGVQQIQTALLLLLLIVTAALVCLISGQMKSAHRGLLQPNVHGMCRSPLLASCTLLGTLATLAARTFVWSRASRSPPRRRSSLMSQQPSSCQHRVPPGPSRSSRSSEMAPWSSRTTRSLSLPDKRQLGFVRTDCCAQLTTVAIDLNISYVKQGWSLAGVSVILWFNQLPFEAALSVDC